MQNLYLKRKTIVNIILIYILIAVCFFFVAGDSLFYRQTVSSMIDPQKVSEEIHKGDIIRQKLLTDVEELNGLNLYGATYARKNNDILTIKIIDSQNKIITEKSLSTIDLKDNSTWNVSFENKIVLEKDKAYFVEITSENGTDGNSISLYYGDSVSAARAEVSVELSKEELLRFNEKLMDGQLCVEVIGTDYFLTGPYYWEGVFVVGLLLITLLLHLYNCERNNKSNGILKILNSLIKYEFLINQLVSRDFKTKYKRSVLGVLWSFLNPLLTMAVQFVIFSTLFKSSIENYPIYLLSGIVCYNFFNEVAGMCMNSITGNDSLIKKVYVPKYIYPLSRSLSSCINFIFSLIPLFGVMLITGTEFHISIVLLIFATLCLYLFSLGVGLILATLMVFFRDTQFLWGVISMIWMYATPIIYPENILPAQLLTILKLNPLYHIIRFFRTVLISGVSPDPRSYIICLIMSFVPLAIGWYIFKKNEDKFVLYL